MGLGRNKARELFDSLSADPEKFSTPKKTYTFISSIIGILDHEQYRERPSHDQREKLIDQVCELITEFSESLKALENGEFYERSMNCDTLAIGAVKIPSLKIIKLLHEKGFDLSFDSDSAFHNLLHSHSRDDEKDEIVQFFIENGYTLKKYLTMVSEQRE